MAGPAGGGARGGYQTGEGDVRAAGGRQASPPVRMAKHSDAASRARGRFSAQGPPGGSPGCVLCPSANSFGARGGSAPGKAATQGRLLPPRRKVAPRTVFFAIGVPPPPSPPPPPPPPLPRSFSRSRSLSPWRSPAYLIRGRDQPMRLGARRWPSCHSGPGTAHPGDGGARGQAFTPVLSSGPRPSPSPHPQRHPRSPWRDVHAQRPVPRPQTARGASRPPAVLCAVV